MIICDYTTQLASFHQKSLMSDTLWNSFSDITHFVFIKYSYCVNVWTDDDGCRFAVFDPQFCQLLPQWRLQWKAHAGIHVA